MKCFNKFLASESLRTPVNPTPYVPANTLRTTVVLTYISFTLWKANNKMAKTK